LFAVVHERFSSETANEPKQKNEQYTPNLFRGKIFCGHCGGRLDRKKNHQHYIYRCTANHATPGSCPGNSIREDTIISAVSKALLEYIGNVENGSTKAQDVKSIETELAELQVEASYDENTPMILYEAFIDRKITEQDYLELKAKYNYRKARQEELWVQLSLQKTEQTVIASEKQELNNIIEEFQDTQFLTARLIDKLIERIDVHDGNRVYVGLNVQNGLIFSDL
jgi:hypothetical protein